ncbi:MAG: hypothetical protein L3K16_00860 [Thermoplasmata archaeon]|nr:hypothetical protein [Thermoplasmata archaeon]
MSRRSTRFGTLALPALVALVLCLVPLTAASGSGFNLSFSQVPNLSVNSNVAITALSTSYSSGPNLTVTTSVSGTIQTANGDYFYDWYFGGGGSDNSTAWVEYSNNTTSADYYGGSSSGGSSGSLPVHVSGGTITFTISAGIVGPSSAFTANAYGEYVNDQGAGSYSYSYLGSNYDNAGCTTLDCVGTGGGGSSGNAAGLLGFGFALLLLIVVLPVVIIIIIIVVVVVLVVRKKPAPTPPPTWQQPPPPGMMPPPPPPPPQ